MNLESENIERLNQYKADEMFKTLFCKNKNKFYYSVEVGTG